MADSAQQALDSRPTDPKTGERVNRFPGTGRLENRQWVPDLLNNALAGQNTSAHPIGQWEHPVKPGYCERHTNLGCGHPDCT